MKNTASDNNPEWIAALMKPDSYDHPVESIQLIETHISWVVLTGAYAYKIKRPVDLGFVDFSSLEKRKFYCEEEVRLNRRLARDIYLAVVAIKGTHEEPRLSGEGEIIEYAVKMVQFPIEAQLDRFVNRDALSSKHIDAFARLIAAFHGQIDRADNSVAYGDLEHLSQPVLENFIQIRQQIGDSTSTDSLSKLESYSRSDISRLSTVFEQRKNRGFVRECHGDLHLANMAWVESKPLVFDCIEFNPNLRWIDVMSEIAFLIMDLEKRGQSRLAYRFLNSYLEGTGDYSGLRVLNFYLVYRVIVRAKVEAIRANQSDASPEERVAGKKAFHEYLQLAVQYSQERPLKLIITHGLSGSGKSTLAQGLVERIGAVRIRSDVERKRLFGLDPEEASQSSPDGNLYSEAANRQTYQKLVELSRAALEGGYSVVVDAACLAASQRELFKALASKMQVPYTILEITASEATLKRRIASRQDGVSDADLNVLETQIQAVEKLQADEKPHAILIDTELPVDMESLVKELNSKVQIP